MTVIKYVEPAPMGSTEEAKSVTTTVHAYDLSQLRQLFKSQLMGVGMMAVMHIYFKYTNPLLIQSIIPLKGGIRGQLGEDSPLWEAGEWGAEEALEAGPGFHERATGWGDQDGQEER